MNTHPSRVQGLVMLAAAIAVFIAVFVVIAATRARRRR
jgi:hypothetical protein